MILFRRILYYEDLLAPKGMIYGVLSTIIFIEIGE